ncbi:phosphoserine phosphatase [Psychromicrobium silvestre]|uniref:phosphoserine phosphatase n=1 Tax=Psychromicrobium silvestre TaxID=1645614 RepID=A0A7Y9LRF2_9MICC|nr:phosphoserine phosphatase SerB [Psychromicrobium silvestre]NYE94217.1 phosphoserine phosphatase [Psychromicrobium silvestre]
MPVNYAAFGYAPVLTAEAVTSLRAALTACGARSVAESSSENVNYAVFRADLEFDGGLPEFRAALVRAMTGVDLRIAVVPTELLQAKRKLFVLDVDSTLIQQEVIELLAAHAGREAEVRSVTEAAMRGELDFAQSLHQRVAALAGLPIGVLAEVQDAIRLSEGAERLIEGAHRAGHLVAAVSGGFSQILDPLAARLGLDRARANELEIIDGLLTGRVSGAVVDRIAKAESLREWAAEAGIPLGATVAIGDGANDLDMLAAAGLGLAYRAKPAVQAAADAQLDRLDQALELSGLAF